MHDCRNCASRSLKELGFIGEVAPFFLKRVLRMEVKTSLAKHPLRLFARQVCAVPQRLFTKIYGCSTYVEMQVCLECSFVQTKHAFSDDALGRLYADYRSAAYNEERIRYEPTYAALANEVGVSDQEVETRVGGLTAWLAGKINLEPGASMLDFGGSDGRFLPRIEAKKYVFEISNISPQPGVVRIAREADLATYSYVQIAHVLEHVGEPLELVKRVSSFVKPGGYLYIEVPQELTDAEFSEFKNGTARRGLPIHEHINFFSVPAVTRMVKAADLDLLSIDSAPIDLGWAASTHIRALCQKRS